jgi:hypothetical protein
VTSDERDVFAIADALEARGWRIDRQASPDSIHHIVTPRHADVVDQYLRDLGEAYGDAPPAPSDGATRTGFYGVTSRIEANDDLETALIHDLARRYDLPRRTGDDVPR